MAEPIAGSPAPQAGQGMTAPQIVPGGGPDPRGSQAPATPATPPEDSDRERLDGAHRKGYREAREQLFRDLGIEWDPKSGRSGYQAAIAKARARLEGAELPDDGPPPGSDADQAGRAAEGSAKGGDQYERLARELQRENAKLRREAEDAARRDELHAARDLAALRVEVRDLLRSKAGFVAEALDDAVDLICPDPSAARLFVGRGPDGVTPTLLERLPDGEVRPARMGLEEWLGQQAKARPWFVAGRVAPGSGGGPRENGSPEGQQPSEAYSYERRKVEIRAARARR